MVCFQSKFWGLANAAEIEIGSFVLLIEGFAFISFNFFFLKLPFCGGRYLAAAWIDSKYCFLF